ncbi:nucleotidyltransferase family protein [Sphingomonas sp.]|jgi:molybdenum cofactor cytidylyltransferase|uniref:nucleotidyltransferase family protein n=1 Tax=Sphingomonas sp. TaxID=28214 RepID=UPI002D7F7C1C|nr:nucleotidyltransferase family protein [Sphingomonas sp.]HEU0043162.1 nucleotidyltransferase family protein [Sphingomonas sp.]
MIALEKTILVLLAAGQSQRFGDEDKLDELFLGKPLGLHVAVALEDMPFQERVAVVDSCRLNYADHGYRVIRNAHAAQGMASSLRVGVTCAKERGAYAVLVALADMPRVTAAHIYRLFDASTDLASVVASSDGYDPKPPALFGRERFDFLLSLEGAMGARDLVRAGRHVVTAPAELIDVDTPADLERLRALVHSKEAITRATARRTGE